ncbi:hypothetical protein NGRA_2803 [Nosema granulosis]|uniref:Uncharacterized protein n=1 Tax=Nosema granulosis TaxID=83296 RepID=A0A9P6KXD1_9MICR|nr:hypothetical protein NGRA_2803 [Nosema granulosis]
MRYKLHLSPLVMANMKHIILGKDVLKNFPHIIQKAWNSNSHTIATMTIENPTNKNRDLMHEYADLFGTEIGEYNLFTAGRHAIDTGERKPTPQRNLRNPVHWRNK